MALDTPSTRITGQFKELQQLRKPVHEAGLNFSRKRRSRRDEVKPTTGGRGSKDSRARRRNH
jgi:hypothetical protein